jgi:hypothetical protein
MKNLFIGALFFALIGTFMISCEKEETANSIDSNNYSIGDLINETPNFDVISASTDLTHEDYIDPINLHVNTRLNDGENLNQLLHLENENHFIVYGLIYFVKDGLVKGYGLHYHNVSEKNNYFSLFNSTVQQKLLLTEMANELIMSDLSTISMKFFNSATVDMIFPKIVNRKNTISSVSDLSLKLSLGDHFKNLSKESTLDKVGGGSGSGCGYVGSCKNGSGVCKPGLFYCAAGGCPAEETPNFSESNASNSDHNQLMSVISLNKYYSFRDDFLLNSSFGQNYIQTFYAVTDHYIEALDLNILSDIVTTLPSINNAIDLLFDSTYDGIIIDESTKDNVLEITSQLGTVKKFVSELNLKIA